MIYDLHTRLHKHTQTHNQLTCRQREWSGDDRRGCTRSVLVALDWQADGSDLGKSKTKGPLSLESPLQAPLNESEIERIRKKGGERGMMFAIVFYYSENAITAHPVSVCSSVPAA